MIDDYYTAFFSTDQVKFLVSKSIVTEMLESGAILYDHHRKHSDDHSLQKVRAPPHYKQSFLYNLIFFQTSHLWQIFCFWQYCPNEIQGINTKINWWGKVISSCLENCKTTLHVFFYDQHLYAKPGWDLTRNNNPMH